MIAWPIKIHVYLLFFSNQLSEAAIAAAQDAIANYTTEQEIASAIKAKLELQFPST